MAQRDPLENPQPLIRRVYAYVAYRIGDGADAEDVTAATFERAGAQPHLRPAARRSARGWSASPPVVSASDQTRTEAAGIGPSNAEARDPPRRGGKALGRRPRARRAALRGRTDHPADLRFARDGDNSGRGGASPSAAHDGSATSSPRRANDVERSTGRTRSFAVRAAPWRSLAALVLLVVAIARYRPRERRFFAPSLIGSLAFSAATQRSPTFCCLYDGGCSKSLARRSRGGVSGTFLSVTWADSSDDAVSAGLRSLVHPAGVAGANGRPPPAGHLPLARRTRPRHRLCLPLTPSRPGCSRRISPLSTASITACSSPWGY